MEEPDISTPAVNRLRALITDELARQSVTQVELANRIGYSQKHVSNSLTGSVGLSLYLAERMLGALGAQLDLAIVRPAEVQTP